MGKLKDLTGQRFGKLVVISRGEDKKFPSGKSHPMWLCSCDCGNTKVINGNNLKSGKSQSCGCSQFDVHTTHGMCGTPTYYTWEGMKRRCLDPKHKAYKYYGGKGVKFDPSWESFEGFLKDMGERPEGLTLDRIDSEGDYCRENCRWATSSIQAHNKTVSDTSSQYKGVSWNRSVGKFQAYIRDPESTSFKEHLGWFDCERLAASAYNAKAIEYYGEFASLNKL